MQYEYLDRIYSILYQINLTVNDKRLIMYDDDKQAEIIGTGFLNLEKRIFLHKQILKELFKKRNIKRCRQLRLFL